MDEDFVDVRKLRSPNSTRKRRSIKQSVARKVCISVPFPNAYDLLDLPKSTSFLAHSKYQLQPLDEAKEYGQDRPEGPTNDKNANIFAHRYTQRRALTSVVTVDGKSNVVVWFAIWFG
jgi:hypothetical protein